MTELFGTKRQRKDLRIVTPWFVQQGIQPHSLSQPHFDEAYRTRLAGLAHEFDENKLRYVLNAFAEVINFFLVYFFKQPTLLSKIAGPIALQQQIKQQFRAQYASCIVSYCEGRAKDNNLSEYDMTPVEENSLYNCVVAAQSKGGTIIAFQDLMKSRIITSIMDWCDENPGKARMVAMMTVLGHLANHAGLVKTRKRVLDKARPNRTPPHLSAQKVRTLTSYANTDRFSSLINALQDVVEAQSDFEIGAIRAANLFTSAIAVLVAIFAPATLETIHAAIFSGKYRDGVFGCRHTLAITNGHDNIEDPLPEWLRKHIDLIFYKYSGEDTSPVSLFSTSSSGIRNKSVVVCTIETLLKDLCPNLTIHDLRDLGVAQMLAAGDSEMTIARASRLSEYAVRTRFENLKQTIIDSRKGR